MNREVVADLLVASPGIVLMATAALGLRYFVGNGIERISHLIFRSIICTSAAVFALMWLRVGWFHVAPHDWSKPTFIDSAIGSYALVFLPSRYVFLFFLYPILEIPLVIRATPEEKDTSILAVTIDFLLAAGNVAMVFVFMVLSLMFSEA